METAINTTAVIHAKGLSAQFLARTLVVLRCSERMSMYRVKQGEQHEMCSPIAGSIARGSAARALREASIGHPSRFGFGNAVDK